MITPISSVLVELVALRVVGVGRRDPAGCRRRGGHRGRDELTSRVVARGRLVGGLGRIRARSSRPREMTSHTGDGGGVAVGRDDGGRVSVRVIAVARRGRGRGPVSGRLGGELARPRRRCRRCRRSVPGVARRRRDGLDQVPGRVVGVARGLVSRSARPGRESVIAVLSPVPS